MLKNSLFITGVAAVLLHSSLGITATLSTGSDNPFIGSIVSETSDDLTLAIDKAQKALFSGKAHDALAAQKYFRENLTAILEEGQFKPETLAHMQSLLADSSVNVREEANRFFEEHIVALFNTSQLSSSNLTALSGKVYESEKNFIVFLSLINAMFKNSMISRDYISTEFSYNMIDGLAESNPQVHKLSTTLLKSYGPDLTSKKILDHSHVTRFITIIKDLPKEHYRDYLSVFQSNLKSWVDLGLVSKADVQNILSSMSRFPDEVLTQLFDFITQPATTASLQKVGLFDQSWVNQIKKDISSGSGPAKQNALNLMAFFLPAFVKSGTMTGKDFRDLWTLIQSDMEAFDDPYAIHKKNYRLLSQAGWFARNDYETLLLNFEDRSVHSQVQTLKYFDHVYDWLRLRNWLGMSQLSKAIESPTGKALELRKLGFKPLAKAVLDKDSEVKKIEEQKIAFVSNHIDSILDNDLFTSDHISDFIKKLRSSNPDVYNKAIDVIDQGLAKWHKLGTLNQAHLDTMLNHANLNADKSAGLVAAFDHNLEGIIPLINKDMIETLTLYLDSGNSEVEDAATRFFEHHRELLETEKLANYSRNELLKQTFGDQDKKSVSKKSSYAKKSKSKKPSSSKHSDDSEVLIGD